MSQLQNQLMGLVALSETVQSVFTLTQSSPESSDFVSVSDCKDWSRVDLSDDDTIIGGLRTAAITYVENVTKLKMLRTTLTVSYNMIPTWQSIELPFGPFFYNSASDLSITYLFFFF